MKRTIKFAAIALLMGTLITGCGAEEEEKLEENRILICKNAVNDDEQGYQSTVTNTVTYNENNEVTKIESLELIISENSELLTGFQTSALETYQTLVQKYGGYEILTSQSETQLEITTTIDYTIFNLEQYVQDEETLRAYVNEDSKLTVKSVTEMYESVGGLCE